MTYRCIYCGKHHRSDMKQEKCKDCEKEYNMILEKLNRQGERHVNPITNNLNHEFCR